MKNLLVENNQLKSHHTKKWLKKKVQFGNYEKSEEEVCVDSAAKPQVKKQYLMSE